MDSQEGSPPSSRPRGSRGREEAPGLWCGRSGDRRAGSLPPTTGSSAPTKQEPLGAFFSLTECPGEFSQGRLLMSRWAVFLRPSLHAGPQDCRADRQRRLETCFLVPFQNRYRRLRVDLKSEPVFTRLVEGNRAGFPAPPFCRAALGGGTRLEGPAIRSAGLPCQHPAAACGNCSGLNPTHGENRLFRDVGAILLLGLNLM